MKEQDYFRELIRECSVDDASVKAYAKAPAPRLTFPRKRAAAIAALCLAAAFATVFAIPTARAEVLSWIGFRLIPIDRTDSEAVNSEPALTLSDFLYANCDVSLGEAVTEGGTLCQTVWLNGLSGLYLLEEWAGGDVASVPVDPNRMRGVYFDTLTDEELSGERILYEHPVGRIRYEFADGSCIGAALDLTDAIEPYLDMLLQKGLRGGGIDANTEAINAENRVYLAQNGLIAAATFSASDLIGHLDENGLLRATVIYSVAVCEEAPDDGAWVPDTELFCAQLGTVTIDLHAWLLGGGR